MAEIVGGIGVPHTPAFAAMVLRDGPGCETAILFGELAGQLRDMRADVLVVFDTDHLCTFFLDNLPIFAIGVAEAFRGPLDEPPQTPQVTVASHPALAAHVRKAAVVAGFDVALVQGFAVGHSMIVPLQFLGADPAIPVVPVFVNGHIHPLPAARRCFALGAAIRQAVEAWPAGLRIVVVGSGSFSLEVNGPRMASGTPFGVPDPAWSDQVCQWMRAAEIEALLEHTTARRLWGAGNVAGELLNWIAMLGAVGARRPHHFAAQPQFGHAYAAWQGR